MRPLLVLFLLPAVGGFIAFVLFRNVRRASFAAAIGSPLVIYALVKVLEPSDPWSAFATFLVSPLVIAVAVITVFICSGRPYRREHRH
jgi:fumarate reductase subunit C